MPLRKELEKGYLLEFHVVDYFTIAATLVTDRDPTLIDTNYIPVAAEKFFREVECDEDGEFVEGGEVEAHEDFIQRVVEEAVVWSDDAIAEHREIIRLKELLAQSIR